MKPNPQPIMPRKAGACRALPGGLARIRAATSRRHGAWFALVAALLMAVTWQSVLTQTHTHAGIAPLAASADLAKAGKATGEPAKHAPAQLPDNCSVCRELAHAGAVLASAPAAIVAPAPAEFLPPATAPPGTVLPGRSHIWRSRAPPIALPA